MKVEDTLTFALDNFEGPLPLLLHLIQRSEIDVHEVSLLSIVNQFLHLLESERTDLNQGAEFIAAASFLLCLKSRALLPKAESVESEEDPHVDIIHHLVDYCRFKGAAKELALLEKKQSLLHTRGIEPATSPFKHTGMAHLALSDLASLFQQMALKLPAATHAIEEEDWKVSDKLASLAKIFEHTPACLFTHLFETAVSKGELIVTFLALLEMMKMGELAVFTDRENAVWISSQKVDGHARQ